MRLLIGTLLSLGVASLLSAPTQANTLRIQPLEYRTTLASGEAKKGCVDISNPDKQPVTVTMSAQAFRQVSDDGVIEFYDNEQVKAGVLPDLTTFDLLPGETIRLFFILDGSRLPSGDVFAALLATAQTTGDAPGTEQTIRVGTLLSIVNGTPGSHQAAITDVSIPFWQFGRELEGRYTIKNTADRAQATGFYPTVTISIEPFGVSKQHQGKLVFAGISRTEPFTVSAERFGLYKVAVSHLGMEKAQWVFMATGGAVKVALSGVVVALLIGVISVWFLRRRQRKNL